MCGPNGDLPAILFNDAVGEEKHRPRRRKVEGFPFICNGVMPYDLYLLLTLKTFTVGQARAVRNSPIDTSNLRLALDTGDGLWDWSGFRADCPAIGIHGGLYLQKLSPALLQR
jgi:hypothetical protein